MIYLIESPADVVFLFGPENKLTYILKIGYTDDNANSNRFSAHRSSNPCMNLIDEIPGATMSQEKMLHRVLEKYRFGFTHEWYFYNKKIINLFKYITLDELSLMENGDEATFRKYGLETEEEVKKEQEIFKNSVEGNPFIRSIIVYSKKLTLPDEQIEACSVTGKAVQYASLRDFRFAYYPSLLFGEDYVRSFIYCINNKTDYAKQILSEYEKITVKIDSYKYLYEERCKDKKKFDRDVLTLLPYEVSNFIIIAHRITDKEWSNKSINVDKLFQRILKITTDADIDYVLNINGSSIKEKFVIGQSYTIDSVKNTLENTFESCIGFKLTPKTTMLSRFFNIKRTRIKVGNKMVGGIKIVSKLL